MPDDEAALRRFQPRLLYDSNEAFFCDSAAEWTDNPANVLQRAAAGGRPGQTLAAATPALGQPKLTLELIGQAGYGSGTEVRGSDRIGCTRSDYRDMYVALRQVPGYANVMYGRAKTDSTGATWLQYWFFYFYNDYHLAGGFGLHEGDWEMIQLRLGPRRTPDLAVYAQHRQAEQAAWEDVRKLPDDAERPLVYVGRGSHASYFAPGLHPTEAWYDIADGGRPAPDLRLELLGEGAPAWVTWPGQWGGTQARIPGIEQPSPRGPAQHPQWDDPRALLKDVRTHAVEPLPGTPHASARRKDGRMVVTITAGAATGPPFEKLVVTVNSPDDRLPPRTFTFAVFGVLHGTLETDLALHPAQRYDIAISTTDTEGRPSGSRTVLIGPEPQHLPGRVLEAIRRFLP